MPAKNRETYFKINTFWTKAGIYIIFNVWNIEIITNNENIYSFWVWKLNVGKNIMK